MLEASVTALPTPTPSPDFLLIFKIGSHCEALSLPELGRLGWPRLWSAVLRKPPTRFLLHFLLMMKLCKVLGSV